MRATASQIGASVDGVMERLFAAVKSFPGGPEAYFAEADVRERERVRIVKAAEQTNVDRAERMTRDLRTAIDALRRQDATDEQIRAAACAIIGRHLANYYHHEISEGAVKSLVKACRAVGSTAIRKAAADLLTEPRDRAVRNIVGLLIDRAKQVHADV